MGFRRKLDAIVLVALILVLTITVPLLHFGSPNPQPPAQRTAPERDCGLLSRFASQAELVDLIRRAPNPGPWILLEGDVAVGPSAARTTAFSGTNVQVAGVGEADIVKTDGVNVYATAWGPDGAAAEIVRAYPPANAALLARIPSRGWDAQLFVSGDRLVVIEGAGNYFVRMGPAVFWEPTTSILIYDISDPANPILARNVTVTAGYAGARMIGDVVYVVANAWLWLGENDTVVLPTIWADGTPRPLTYADIGSFRDSEGSHVDTLVLAVNVRSGDPPAFESFLTNGASQLYVSPENLYIVSAEWIYSNDRVVRETSTVHKVAIADTVHYVCSVRVPGTVLNQFSLDEHLGYLRVATTFGQWSPEGRETSAGAYVLDDLLHPVGQVTGLARGERVFAARFLGDRAYLVTYRQVDPLFVLDLSDPDAPRVLGYLKVAGVSDYLHPYGDRYLIGLGRNDPDGTGRLHGVKLSLFDVADVEHPREVASFVIGGGENEWSYSEAQYEHKAFLFVPGRDLVVIPVFMGSWDSGYAKYEGWAGAYVVSVSPQGFALRGTVAHGGNPEDAGSQQVHRSLYIGDYLYTVSNAYIVASQLDTLQEVARVPL